MDVRTERRIAIALVAPTLRARETDFSARADTEMNFRPFRRYVPRRDDLIVGQCAPLNAAPGQERECQAGNERYTRGQTVVGNQPGNQGTKTSGQVAP